jgi:hypothetical protein
MTIKWSIDLARRRMTATCADVVTVADVFALFDAVVVDGALPFAKVMDMNDAKSGLTGEDMQLIGARVQAYSQHMTEPMGPLAIVARSAKDQSQAQLFVALAQGRRPIEIFSSVRAAEEWLDRQEPKP